MTTRRWTTMTTTMRRRRKRPKRRPARRRAGDARRRRPRRARAAVAPRAPSPRPRRLRNRAHVPLRHPRPPRAAAAAYPTASRTRSRSTWMSLRASRCSSPRSRAGTTELVRLRAGVGASERAPGTAAGRAVRFLVCGGQQPRRSPNRRRRGALLPGCGGGRSHATECARRTSMIAKKHHDRITRFVSTSSDPRLLRSEF